MADSKPTIFSRLKRGLFMTHTELISRVGEAIKSKFEPDPRALEALEEALILADVGPSTARELVEAVREEAGRKGSEEAGLVRRVLRAEIASRLTPKEPAPAPVSKPRVVLLVGVNGTGKTTTTAKLAARARQAGQRVVLAAAETFRAAAIDQIRIWSERIDATFV
ncbi:MAG: signal recognition particle receptor subunit alpha, partial [Acidobacteria bacterium]|nr:signal recognition particle receptor subunit alpha [Acidobacteriota bacterium]